MMNKKEIIKVLEQIAVYMEIKGENAFRVSAYRKAAQALEQDERSLRDIDDVSKLNGIGKGTAAIINELIETGESSVLNELKEEIPEGLIPLLKLPGLGGKKLGKLYQELGVKDRETLKEACESNRIQELAGFGKKSEEKILHALEEANTRPERLPIATVEKAAQFLKDRLASLEDVRRFELAGSYRRARETVKDLDFIVSTDAPASVRESLLNMGEIGEIIGQGDTKLSFTVIIDDDFPLSVDVRLVEDEAFATTLHHFTGSKDHNVLMRQLAKDQGEKISEYGVENVETGEVKTFEDETAFFNHFGLSFIPPEVREGRDELAQFPKDSDLQLISNDDIRGDLHMHTTWSDGAHSIDEMIEACRTRGYDMMAITDHSQFLKVANGLTVERLKRQHEQVRMYNEQYEDMTIFTGIEMDILPDGSLDYDDDVLENIDFVIASIHSSFQQDRNTIQQRLETAARHPKVAMIAHPTGRLIGRRDGYDVDLDWLIDLAKETGTILECNANPNRLDLSAEWLEKAQKAGVPIAINTDAHRIEMLDHMPMGVSTAKRGWLNADSVVNTWGAERLKAWIDKKQT
ncbi:DNA polymerase/3'-5' exonuclease PolX [Texcoconibacillus texcoconensis]|uniref:DNA-directed DNA polymerase n=1 Tax=Texcoconibacillus texcoconensis TaxID=1095777 RepID=A0A840QMU9_9BACI|nr:DNA polymerase/3'-5' exonuclease PolX [Texcoconibacillus texcoconensis]MBB5172686.1 DNA polymerase (family 10) [Texcoconibacillus texcoconensis]